MPAGSGNEDRSQLEQLREYWGSAEDGLLRSILSAASDLAVAFNEYDRHMRHGIHGADPAIERMVTESIIATMRASARHILRHSPEAGQSLDDIKELLTGE